MSPNPQATPPDPTTGDPLWSVAEPICEEHGVELVQVRLLPQRGRRVLRVLIDRPPAPGTTTAAAGSGVTLGDCTAVSRALGDALEDRDDLVSGAYELEVGSPGVERPLHRPVDFDRFAGREIRVQTRAPVGGRRKLTGVLRGLDGPDVQLDVAGEDAPVRIPFEAITKANLVFRF